MSEKAKVFQRFVVVFGALIIIIICSVNLVFQLIENSWDNHMATRIAAGHNISAFGDDTHAVPIVPGNILEIGETSSVFGIEITLNNAGFLKPADKAYVDEMEYWFVEFTGKSITNEIQYDINPLAEEQLQYLQGNSYIWKIDEIEYQ